MNCNLLSVWIIRVQNYDKPKLTSLVSFFNKRRNIRQRRTLVGSLTPHTTTMFKIRRRLLSMHKYLRFVIANGSTNAYQCKSIPVASIKGVMNSL